MTIPEYDICDCGARGPHGPCRKKEEGQPMKDKQLKPCPWGHKAEIKFSISRYYIICEDIHCWCGAAPAIYKTEQKAIEAWNNRTDGWISIEERLPEYNKPVLCLIKHSFLDIPQKQIILIYVNEDDCNWRVEDFGKYKAELSFDYDVTHWKSLPEPKNEP